MYRHIPHGMCGLKFSYITSHISTALSHPSRDVWIEILNHCKWNRCNRVTSLTGCVDWNSSSRAFISLCWRHIPHGMCGLKFLPCGRLRNGIKSHPSRDVWIEIQTKSCNPIILWVTSLTGCVDWNILRLLIRVAPRRSHIPHGMCGLKYLLMIMP